MRIELGFDIGGTFTDLALVDSDTGRLHVYKVLTTPTNPETGARDGINDFLTGLQLQHRQVSTVLHATTLAANTLIEHKGACVGLITTEGFRDVLEMRTEQRYAIYDLFLEFPEPLSPRHLRRGIRERIDRDGRVLTPVCADEVRRVIRDFREAGVEAIAVALLHAYRNPEHERQVHDLIRDEWPDVFVSLSSVVAPEIREYERTSTTAANAYVQPLMVRYLDTLAADLDQAGFEGRFYMMLSSGSTAPLGAAQEQPIRLVESGPAAGAIAAAYFGGLAGYRDLVAFDMGGTTAKVTLIDGGNPVIASSLEVARTHRFKKGSGYPLQFPTVDILESGAGGGSIAWIDALGLLKVGPQSAGSSPGPASYGFGGNQPTVTDADLVLGYLNPDYFLGGKMQLDMDAAVAALRTVADPLGWTVIETASAIHQLVNENMAASAKIHLLEKARDPRNYALISFGGAGPVHAAGVAQILGSPGVVVAPYAGVASAIGLLIAPVAFDFARSFPTSLEHADWSQIEALYADMEAQGKRLLADAGIGDDQVYIARSVDGHFQGQLHEIEVPLPADFASFDREVFVQSFYRAYRQLYHHVPHHTPIELLTWRVRVSGTRTPIRIEKLPRGTTDIRVALKGYRQAYFREAAGYVETPVYDRYSLLPEMRFEGPAIVEERESTTVVRPGMSGRVDDYGNLLIQLEGTR